MPPPPLLGYLVDMKAVLICIMTVSGFAGFAFAQSDELRELVLERVEESRRFQFPDKSHFSIESLLTVDPVSPEEFERLRLLAPTDRTAKYHFERIQMERQAGGSRRRIDVYTQGSRSWRINTTQLTHPGSPFTDDARGKEGYWTYSQDQLQYAKDLQSLPSDVQFHPEAQLSATRLVFASLATGVAGTGNGAVEVSVIERSREGAKVLVRGDERSLLIEGTFVPHPSLDKHDFQIHRVQVLDLSGKLVAVNEYKDWQHYPEWGISLANHRRTTLADGRPFSEYRVTHAGVLSYDIEDLTKAPRPDGTDLLRGASSYRSVVDHSKGLRSIFDIESGSFVSERSTRSSYSSQARLVIGILIVLAGFCTFVAVHKGRHKS